MQSYSKIVLFSLIYLPFCHLLAEDKSLINNQEDLLVQCLQKLENQEITLDVDIKLSLIQHLEELADQKISPGQIIDICCDQATQKQLALDDAQFYKNLLWIGAGCLVIAGIGVVAYIALKKDPKPTIVIDNIENGDDLVAKDQDPQVVIRVIDDEESDDEEPLEVYVEESPAARNARWDRQNRGTQNQDDIARGLQNINHIRAQDPDPQLRGLLDHVVIQDGQEAHPRLTQAELRAIPHETFQRAEQVVRENLYQDHHQILANINELMDRYTGYDVD